MAFSLTPCDHEDNENVQHLTTSVIDCEGRQMLRFRPSEQLFLSVTTWILWISEDVAVVYLVRISFEQNSAGMSARFNPDCNDLHH